MSNLPDTRWSDVPASAIHSIRDDVTPLQLDALLEIVHELTACHDALRASWFDPTDGSMALPLFEVDRRLVDVAEFAVATYNRLATEGDAK